MTFTKKLSFAIHILDDFTRGSPLGNYAVTIDQKSVKPMKVVDGMLVYMNLDNETYTIRIESQYYLNKEVVLEKEALNPLNPIFKIFLNPSPAYPFSRYDTVIRFELVDENTKSVVPEANVLCHVTSKEYYLGKLKKGIGPGDREMSVALIEESLEKKVTYALVSDEEVASLVICDKVLDQYLVGEFRGPPVEKGTLVCPAINTVTDIHGNGIIYLNKFRNSSVDLVLALSYEGREKHIHLKVNEYEDRSLGQLTL